MFVIFGKDSCSFCEKAKNLLDSRNEPYTYVLVGLDVTIEELRAICPVPISTVPQIFIGNHILETEKYIGGYTELVEYLKTPA